jgi:hypothetical protein
LPVEARLIGRAVDELAGERCGVEEGVKAAGVAGVSRRVVELSRLDCAGLADKTVVDEKDLSVAGIAL